MPSRKSLPSSSTTSTPRKCQRCGSKTTDTRQGWSKWYSRGNDQFICHRCYAGLWRQANRDYLSAVELGRYYRRKLKELEQKDKRLVRRIESKRKKMTVTKKA